MYTNVDLRENERMNEIIKTNQIKVREFNEIRAKKQKEQEIFNSVFGGIALSILFFSMMIVVAVIEMI